MKYSFSKILSWAESFDNGRKCKYICDVCDYKKISNNTFIIIPKDKNGDPMEPLWVDKFGIEKIEFTQTNLGGIQ